MKRILLGSILMLFACQGPIIPPAEGADKQTPAQKKRPPVIDMHMHADLPPIPIAPGASSICRPHPCTGEGRATANQAQTMRDTLAAMDRYDVVKAYLSGRDPEVVQNWVEAAPGRFIAAPFILDPAKSDPAKIRAQIKAGKMGGVGEIASQLVGVPPNDPRLEPYFAMAEELDVPVLIHTLGIGPEMPTFRVAAGNPVLLEDVLVKHPKLRIFVENSGYPYDGEMIAMMSQYPNLYGDVSTISWVLPRRAFHAYLERLVDAGLGKRIMFGSDQMRWPDRIGEGIAAIEEAPFLTEPEKRDILYNNAARFLRLDENGNVRTARRSH